MLSNRRKNVKKESLQIQLEFLDVLQSRHLLWVNDSDDPEITHLHLEILELIRQIKEPYNKLVDIYIYI